MHERSPPPPPTGKTMLMDPQGTAMSPGSEGMITLMRQEVTTLTVTVNKMRGASQALVITHVPAVAVTASVWTA